MAVARALCVLAAPRLAPRLSLAAAFSTVSRRPPRGGAVSVNAGGLEDVFTDKPWVEEEEENVREMSKTSQRKRYDELRKLGREIVRLAPRTVERLQLSPDLTEVVLEWNRVGGKRGSGSAKKGKARLEGLLAQMLIALPVDEQKTLERVVRAMQAGTAVLSSPSKRQKAALNAAGAGAKQAAAWVDGVLRGSPAEEARRNPSFRRLNLAAATGEIFAAVERLNERQWDAPADADAAADGEAGPSGRAMDRGELRQLIQRAQNEARYTVAAAIAKAEKTAAVSAAYAAAKAATASAAAAAAGGGASQAAPAAAAPPPPPVRVTPVGVVSRRVAPPGPVERQLLKELTELAEHEVADDGDDEEEDDEEEGGDDGEAVKK